MDTHSNAQIQIAQNVNPSGQLAEIKDMLITNFEKVFIFEESGDLNVSATQKTRMEKFVNDPTTRFLLSLISGVDVPLLQFKPGDCAENARKALDYYGICYTVYARCRQAKDRQDCFVQTMPSIGHGCN